MHAVCTQCARSAKFWMSANTRTLVLAPFHKFLVLYQGFFWLPKHLGCGTKTLVDFKVILEPRCSRSSIGMATSTTAEKSTWSSSLKGS